MSLSLLRTPDPSWDNLDPPWDTPVPRWDASDPLWDTYHPPWNARILTRIPLSCTIPPSIDNTSHMDPKALQGRIQDSKRGGENHKSLKMFQDIISL